MLSKEDISEAHTCLPGVVPHPHGILLLLIANNIDTRCVRNFLVLHFLDLVEDGEAAWAGSNDTHTRHDDLLPG